MTSRQTAFAGFAFGPLLLVGLLLASTPDLDESDAHWVRWFTDGGHQARLIVCGALLILAALAWVAFSAGLRERTEPGRAAGGFAALAAAGIGLGGTLTLYVPAVLAESDSYAPPADVLRVLDSVGYAVLAFNGMLAAGVALVLTLRAGGLPRGLVIAGYVVAGLQIAALYFVPMLLFGLWALAAAGVLVRRPLQIPLPA